MDPSTRWSSNIARRRRAADPGLGPDRVETGECLRDAAHDLTLVDDTDVQIHGRIRDALVDRPAAVVISRDYERVLPPGADVAELFDERVSDYRTTVHRTTAAGLRRPSRPS